MIIGIVQARMGSKRLPGKVMKEVLGKPLIGYLLERLSRSKKIDGIVLATSVNKENDILCDYVEGIGYEVFRGSEQDVLGRYYQAAKKYNAKTVVRITGDCPLIDPGVCDELVKLYSKNGAEVARITPRLAEGLDCEVFSFKVLEYMHKNAERPSEKEHVTMYITNNPAIFKINVLEKAEDEGMYRITVDEPEDFEVVKNIIENLYKPGEFFDFGKIKNYLDQNPDIFRINAHITRNEGLKKSLDNEKS